MVAPGPHGLPGLLVVRRLRREGFIVMDYDEHGENTGKRMIRVSEEPK
ncbi:MAG: hypothetical protein O2967_23505 [Proteobacteria bacterium]|nr:hypothetical protein [Pseudomonadota bacterium]